MAEHQYTQQPKKTDNISQKQTIPPNQISILHHAAIIQRARISPKSLTHADVMQLQRTIGNRAVGKLLTEIGLIPSRAKQAPPVQMQTTPEEDKKLQMKSVLQRQEKLEEEEPIQGKFASDTIQESSTSCSESPNQGKENRTGIPDNLKASIEDLSGIDMSDVRVHYNSSKPADVGALAYTQGTDIHVAPGQERHLPHEAWHVVQQAQGRVQPTIQLKGIVVNDDVGLENEASIMGNMAAELKKNNYYVHNSKQNSQYDNCFDVKNRRYTNIKSSVIQQMPWWLIALAGVGIGAELYRRFIQPLLRPADTASTLPRSADTASTLPRPAATASTLPRPAATASTLPRPAATASTLPRSADTGTEEGDIEVLLSMVAAAEKREATRGATRGARVNRVNEVPSKDGTSTINVSSYEFKRVYNNTDHPPRLPQGFQYDEYEDVTTQGRIMVQKRNGQPTGVKFFTLGGTHGNVDYWRMWDGGSWHIWDPNTQTASDFHQS